VIDLKNHKNSKIYLQKGEGDDEHEVIEIKGSGKNGTYVIRKDKDGKIGQSKWTSKDGKVIIHEKDHDQGLEWEDEDGQSIIIKSLGKGKNRIFLSTSGDSDGDPLLIIDGKEQENKNINDLDSGNIESINVLKGESATKKYGEKGKNGVIEVTTKKKKD
jgi:TonB-dependent SusC/RagA subfamily outer membrane receptor